jgi:xanthine dehydrogenase molybdopterin-binding subunit B
MKHYRVCYKVQHVLVLQAESEAEARRKAQQSAFSDWEHFPRALELEEVPRDSGTIPRRVVDVH